MSAECSCTPKPASTSIQPKAERKRCIGGHTFITETKQMLILSSDKKFVLHAYAWPRREEIKMVIHQS